MTSSRQFPPRLPQEDRAVESRLGFAGSRAGRARNAGPILQVDRVTAQVSAASQVIETSFWQVDHFTVSSTTPGTFALTYLPRDNSEDVTVNGVTLLPGTDWTRTGATLTITSGVWLGLTGSWDLLVQYEVAAAAPTVATQLYSDAVLALGPWLYWPLSDSTGSSAADLSGHGRTGGPTGSLPTPLQPAIAPGLGNSMLFTAASGTDMSLAGASMAGFQLGWTLTAWCKPNTATGRALLIGSGYDGSTQPFDMGIAATSNDWVAEGSWFGSYKSATAASGPTVGTAYFVAATYDGVNTIKTYVNGSLVATNAAAGVMPTPGGPTTGYILAVASRADGLPSQFFDGYISDVAIWQGTPLTGTQIASLYTAGTA